MPSEFELIGRYFARDAGSGSAALGIGDDAALVAATPGHELVMTTDTLVCGTHFFPDVEPTALGHKTLSVNLSDLAAMGARPRWVLLAITLPDVDEAWLAQFASGFFELALKHDVVLIGGDTTRGPLSITVTAIGEVAQGRALRRDGACVGDGIWVSGQLGSAALALRHRRGEFRLRGQDLKVCCAQLDMPMPRVDLGGRRIIKKSSAIDVSDGLIADTGDIARACGLGMEVRYGELPAISSVLRLKHDPQVRDALLCGGDDYELLFTVPADAAERLDGMSASLGLALTRIGQVVPGAGVAVIDGANGTIDVDIGGYDHFA
jgi:thiamine-monophosphate kinase